MEAVMLLRPVLSRIRPNPTILKLSRLGSSLNQPYFENLVVDNPKPGVGLSKARCSRTPTHPTCT